MSFTATLGGLSELERLATALKNPGDMLDRCVDAMALDLTGLVREVFQTQGASIGASWPAKRDPDGRAILTGKTGNLRNSFVAMHGSRDVTVDTDVPYASVHQFGATVAPKTKPMLSWVGGDGKRRFAKSVTIPARPMLPATLPAEWEESLVSVIDRAIARWAKQ